MSKPSVTLHLGDCLEALGAVPSGSVRIVVTDPPYLLGAASARKSADKAIGWADINNAARWYADWMREAWRMLSPDGSLWVFGNWRSLPVYQCAASKVAGMSILSVVVWDRQWPSVGSTRGLRQNYEVVALFGKPEFAIADRSVSDIWPCKWAGHRPSGHPQEKPVPLIRRMIDTAKVPPGETLCDPFTGSGSSAVAAIEAGLNFIGAEMEENHHAVALRRIALATPPLAVNEVAPPSDPPVFRLEAAP